MTLPLCVDHRTHRHVRVRFSVKTYAVHHAKQRGHQSRKAVFEGSRCCSRQGSRHRSGNAWMMSSRNCCQLRTTTNNCNLSNSYIWPFALLHRFTDLLCLSPLCERRPAPPASYLGFKTGFQCPCNSIQCAQCAQCAQCQCVSMCLIYSLCDRDGIDGLIFFDILLRFFCPFSIISLVLQACSSKHWL